MLLGKYQIIKRLGKGAFGDVVLAEDKSKKKYAIKMMSFKSFQGDNAYLLEYLESEIKCLKQLCSEYVMRLYHTDEDKKFKYMICQYCDGGDLITVQSKQPNRVFSLQKASEILSFVIKGLYSLHDAGFVHRDIKAENILMKTENGKQIYKLGDFGFTKNIKDISYTILGTGAYMSPELYSQEEYGFEVDMWAFGVLFYFMLNMEFPFKASMAPKTKKKSEQLIAIATDFSYKKFVENSRKKILTNCTPDIQDLFKKIFNPNPKQRINFHAIKSHPVFAKYFTGKQNDQSKILYTTKSKVLKTINPKIGIKQFLINAKPTSGFVTKPSKILESSQNIYLKQKAKVQFLKETLLEISKNGDLPSTVLLSLKFNIQKYIIMILKKLQKTLNEKKNSKNQESRWTNFFKSKQFTYNQNDLLQQIKKCEFEMQKIYVDCDDNLRSIIQVNKYFNESFNKETNALDFSGTFKSCYRRSTVLCYQQIIKKVKQESISGNIYNYQLALITICHAFNKIFEDQNTIKSIFEDYFKTYPKKQQKDINYLELKAFMAECTPKQLNSITNEIINKFFQKKK